MSKPTAYKQGVQVPYKWFARDELECPCCHKLAISHNLMRILDEMRNRLEEPIYINSGYRCKKHNAKVGGASRSNHMAGLALDIRAKIAMPVQLWELAQQVRDDIDPEFELGFGLYDTFLHLSHDKGEHFDRRSPRV